MSSNGYGKLSELEDLVQKAKKQGAPSNSNVDVTYRRGGETTSDSWTITVTWTDNDKD